MSTSMLPPGGAPGVSGVPWLVRSPTRAAAGILTPLVELDRLPAHRARTRRAQREELGRDLDVGRLERELQVGRDLDGDALDLDRLRRVVERDLERPRRVRQLDLRRLDRDLLLRRGDDLDRLERVVELDLVADTALQAGLEHALALGIRDVRDGRAVVRAPEAAEDVRVARAALADRDQHLVVDPRAVEEPRAGPAARRREARPDLLVDGRDANEHLPLVDQVAGVHDRAAHDVGAR